MNRILIGWPTLESTDTIDTINGVVVRVNNQMPTPSDVTNLPGYFLETDCFGNSILCTETFDGSVNPVIVDSNNNPHYAKPWILIPVTGNEYVGGHPLYVPKPPTK